MVDLTKFFDGGFKPMRVDDAPRTIGSSDPGGDFIRFMNELGFRPQTSEPIIAKLQRIPSPSDKNNIKKTGWYVYHEIMNEGYDEPFGYGIVGCNRTKEQHHFVSKQNKYMTPMEREDLERKKNIAQEIHKRDLEESQTLAANEALEVWKNKALSVGMESHPYVIKKGIKPYASRICGNTLIIPVARNDGTLISIQKISPSGRKLFMKGSSTTGGFCYIDGDESVIYICEGWATGCTIREVTGNKVMVAFDAHNLIKVAPIVQSMHGSSRIIIAADNDIESEKKVGVNTGVKFANEAAILIGAEVIISPVNSDFNDYYVEYGHEETKKLFTKEQENHSIKIVNHDSKLFSGEPPPLPDGIMKQIYNFYLATDKTPQPLLAMQTALAACSMPIARQYATNEDNFSALFLANVCRTGQGKQHSFNVSTNLLDAWDMIHTLSGKGYTSQGAVLTELTKRPRHLVQIDEFGPYISGAKKQVGGMQHASSFDLMSVYGVANGVFRGMNYSAGKDAGKEGAHENDSFIYNPSITLLGASAPRTFFDAISLVDVESGFLNRFIIAIPDPDVMIRPKSTNRMEIPQPIVEWGRAINQRAGYQQHLPKHKPTIIEIPFFVNCNAILEDMIDYQLQRVSELEISRLEDMAMRVREQAMRLSLIAALAEDPMAKYVDAKHLQWGFDYVRFHHERLTKYMTNRVSYSDYDRMRNEYFMAIKLRGARGMSRARMNQELPFRKNDPRMRDNILADLVASRMVTVDEERVVGARGRPKQIYRAIESEEE